MFDSKGDKAPPCGVPSSTGLISPPSITPAVRNARISFNNRLSLTLSAILAISLSWFTRSKNFSRSRAISCCDVLLRLHDRLMRRPPRTKPVAVLGERPVPSALQNLHDRRIDPAPSGCQAFAPSVRLRDFHPLHRLGHIGPAQQLFPDRWPVLLQVSRKIADGRAVHAGAPFVGLDS